MENNRLFLGIKQVTKNYFDNQQNKKGYVWFVKIDNSHFEIYLGSNKYGETNTINNDVLEKLRTVIGLNEQLELPEGFGYDSIINAINAINLDITGITESVDELSNRINELSTITGVTDDLRQAILDDEEVYTKVYTTLQEKIGLTSGFTFPEDFGYNTLTEGVKTIESGLTEVFDVIETKIKGGLIFKGTVNYYNDLPSDSENGDMYEVKYHGESGEIEWDCEFAFVKNEGQEGRWVELGGIIDTQSIENDIEALQEQISANTENINNIETNIDNIVETIQELDDTINKKENKLIAGTDNVILEESGNTTVISVLGSSQSGSTVTDLMFEVTYNELKELRDNKELIKGAQYRITDYVTTTIQEGTQSAGHQFDIIVTADDIDKLNENARACKNANDIKHEETIIKHVLGNPESHIPIIDAVYKDGYYYLLLNNNNLQILNEKTLESTFTTIEDNGKLYSIMIVGDFLYLSGKVMYGIYQTNYSEYLHCVNIHSLQDTTIAIPNKYILNSYYDETNDIFYILTQNSNTNEKTYQIYIGNQTIVDDIPSFDMIDTSIIENVINEIAIDFDDNAFYYECDRAFKYVELNGSKDDFVIVATHYNLQELGNHNPNIFLTTNGKVLMLPDYNGTRTTYAIGVVNGSDITFTEYNFEEGIRFGPGANDYWFKKQDGKCYYATHYGGDYGTIYKMLIAEYDENTDSFTWEFVGLNPSKLLKFNFQSENTFATRMECYDVNLPELGHELKCYYQCDNNGNEKYFYLVEEFEEGQYVDIEVFYKNDFSRIYEGEGSSKSITSSYEFITICGESANNNCKVKDLTFRCLAYPSSSLVDTIVEETVILGGYFNDSNLDAWKLKYSLDNNQKKYIWATEKYRYIEIQYPDYPEYTYYYAHVKSYDNEKGYAWLYINNEEPVDKPDFDRSSYYMIYLDTDTPEIGETYYDYEDSPFTVLETGIKGIDGYGVIYEMTDEYNNTCPYDFKNIQFKRYKISGLQQPTWRSEILMNNNSEYLGDYYSLSNYYDFDYEIYIYYYTFTYKSPETGLLTDASLNLDEENSDYRHFCENNKLLSEKYSGYMNFDEYIKILPNNVFIGSYDFLCNENIFDALSLNNTLYADTIMNNKLQSSKGNLFAGEEIYFNDILKLDGSILPNSKQLTIQSCSDILALYDVTIEQNGVNVTFNSSLDTVKLIYTSSIAILTVLFNIEATDVNNISIHDNSDNMTFSDKPKVTIERDNQGNYIAWWRENLLTIEGRKYDFSTGNWIELD